MTSELKIVIGVDESHSDSLEAIQGGLSFADSSNKTTLKASLFSVVSKAQGTELDLKKRLEKIYKDITESYTRTNPLQAPIAFHTVAPFGSDSVAASLIKEAVKERADLIAIGAGKTTTSGGSLGSVANEIVLRSLLSHVLVCKRSSAGAKFQQGRGRNFMIAIDGSIASRVGLQQLVTRLCKKGDTIRAVTVSDNSKDLILVEAEVAANKAAAEEKGVKITAEHIPRKNKTAAEVLCEVATECSILDDPARGAITALVLGSSNGSSTELGSCTKWCVVKCPISVLVMKVSVAE